MKNAFKKLKIPTKKWVKAVQNAYELQEHHDRLLIMAGQMWDRAQEAKSIIDADGSVILDKFNQKKIHPGIEIERQSMITFSRLLREIGLDLTEQDNRPPSRPGGYN